VELRRLTLTLPATRAPEIERLLELAGAVSISYADAGDTPLLEPASGTVPLWPEVRVEALFAPDVDIAALGRLLAPAVSVPLVWDRLHTEAWRAALTQAVEPRPIGRRLMLVPAAWRGDCLGREIVRLHLGLAFGTGEHPTTALCLEWLERAPLRGRRLLDFGCGSGVLAIAALVLGAERAWAVDNEPQALVATRRNATANAVGDSIWIGPPASLPTLEADIVVANIIAGTLIESARWIAQRAAPGGRLVLSGILEEQRRDVVRAFEEHFERFEYAARSGWLLLTAEAKQAERHR
jgi:ribosomal protein L11 methyltransferase